MQFNCISMNSITQKSDTFGVISSTLCMLHCLATPLLFLSHASTTGAEAPVWWKWIDIVFLVISFLAVYQSAKTTSRQFMKPALWGSWLVLAFAILNEKFELFHLPEALTYVAAITLTILHVYNLKYCNCKTDTDHKNHE